MNLYGGPHDSPDVRHRVKDIQAVIMTTVHSVEKLLKEVCCDGCHGILSLQMALRPMLAVQQDQLKKQLAGVLSQFKQICEVGCCVLFNFYLLLLQDTHSELPRY